MGRLGSLTAWALGRNHYEEEIIRDPEEGDGGSQVYDARGRPKNSETKKREREQIRAANEVMQITGVVEDSNTAKLKASQALLDKTMETYKGLRILEVGRAVMVGGIWGVLGLRRRILLYKPYTHIGIPEILIRESQRNSIPHVLFAGLPTVVAYHAFDWVAFVAESLLDSVFDEDENELSEVQKKTKASLQGLLDIAFCYITLHFRMFAMLQQLDLIPSSRLLPSFMSFLPFSASSPMQMPPSPSLNIQSLLTWGAALLRTASPLLVILAHGQIKYAISQFLYRPIYQTLPRPIGESMFAGLSVQPPLMEYDTPDHDTETQTHVLIDNEPILPSIEILPPLERIETRSRNNDSDDEEVEISQASLISFDVEPTEVVEPSLGQWSAELRSSQEPKSTGVVRYSVTGITMLPTIMATEALREVVAGMIVLPIEALMVRIVGRAYQNSAGLGVVYMYQVNGRPYGFVNLLAVFGMQLAVGGLVWAGFTWSTQRWAVSNRKSLIQEAEKDN